MTKKVLVINYYRSRDENTKGVNEIRKAIEEAGGKADVIHYTDAKSLYEKGTDILKGYHSAHVSGSDISWKEKDGKMAPPEGTNDFFKYLIDHKNPVKFDCGSAQAAYHAAISRESKEVSEKYGVRNSGKFNKGTGSDGFAYNHKYGMAPVDTSELENKISDIRTLKHAGQEYIASATIGNNHITQYHPGRTKIGKEEVKRFHGLNEQYNKAA